VTTTHHLRRTLSSLPSEVRVLCVVAFAVLVVLPVAITAARNTSFAASVSAFPIDQPRTRPIHDTAAYVRTLLRDPLVFQGTATAVRFPVQASSLPANVDVTSIPDGALITARGDSPDHARLLASALAAQVANASARDLVTQTKAALARAVPRAARQQLQSDLSRTRFALAMGPRPGPPRPTGVVDRALEWLPGSLPPRPSPAWIALVGLAVTALVWAAAVAQARPAPGEPWVGAWLLPLSRDERADLLTFTQKAGAEREEELALMLVESKQRDARQWQDIVQEFAVRFPPTRKRFRVLLFGCGAGDEALMLAEADFEVTMIDADPLLLEFVQHRLRRRDLAATAVVINPRRPVIDGSFDGVFVRELRSDGLNRSLAAQAVRGALRPGAMLVEKRPPSPALRREGRAA
jgi:hypothetical protein